MTRAKHPKGIRPWKGKWQAYIRVNGRLVSKVFALDTDLSTIKAWRAAQALTRSPRQSGTFKRDVVRYLRRVRAMPTYQQRRQHLIFWLNALGWQRNRSTITTAEIDRVLQGWLDTCARDTVRKRRTALLAMFHKLDGKAAANPVRESTPPKPQQPTVRGLDTATLQRVLDSLPPSKTAARLKVMAWTGLPPGMLMRVRASDLDLERAELRVGPREKGAGSHARMLPLTPQAVKAFQEMALRQAFGAFAIAAAGRVLHRGCKRCGVQRIRLYDLRHSFGALLYRTTKDLPTVARFLLHKNLTSTARYAHAAIGDVDRAAAQAVGQLPGQHSPPLTAPTRTTSHRSRGRTRVPRNTSKSRKLLRNGAK